jgi:hypothetical protein
MAAVAPRVLDEVLQVNLRRHREGVSSSPLLEVDYRCLRHGRKTSWRLSWVTATNPRDSRQVYKQKPSLTSTKKSTHQTAVILLESATFYLPLPIEGPEPSQQEYGEETFLLKVITPFPC